MKLVEILAKEWKEWPHGCDHAVCDSDGEIRAIGSGTHNDFYPSEAVDVDDRLSGTALLVSHDGKEVTRADWEKEKMKHAAPKKNAEGWIRHRGGKCPVEGGVVIEYRERNGNIDIECEPELLGTMWIHENSPHDIMAYRRHKPVEQVEACSKPELQINLQDSYGEIYNAQAIPHGPLQWRDRIAEIDATTQALTTERAELVQKLASEGFALIGRVVEPVEDMSDWRNWKAGDILLITSNKSGHQFQLGDQVRIGSKSKPSASGCGFSIEHLDGSGYWYVDSPDLEFRSRPSA